MKMKYIFLNTKEKHKVENTLTSVKRKSHHFYANSRLRNVHITAQPAPKMAGIKL